MSANYYDPTAAGAPIHVLHARDDFLFHVVTVEPRVLDTLRAVHDFFLTTEYAEAAHARPPSFAPAVPPLPSADSVLMGRLMSWAAGWSLTVKDPNDPWVLRAGWQTLFDWTGQEERSMFSPCRPASTLAPGSTRQIPLPPFSFQVPAWPMEVWSREEMREWVERAFMRRLTDYLDQAEEGAKRAGWEPVARSNTRFSLPADRHFQWLARYQCGGEAQTEIADADGISANKISAGINKAARLIGLSVYNGKARPRGPRVRKGKNR